MTADDNMGYGSDAPADDTMPLFANLLASKVRCVTVMGAYAFAGRGEKQYPLGEIPPKSDEAYLQSVLGGSGGLFVLVAVGGATGNIVLQERRIRLDGEVTWPVLNEGLMAELRAEQERMAAQVPASIAQAPQQVYSPPLEPQRQLFPGVHVLKGDVTVAEDLPAYEKQEEINRQRREGREHSDMQRLFDAQKEMMKQQWNSGIALLREVQGGANASAQAGGGADAARVETLKERIDDLKRERDKLDGRCDQLTKDNMELSKRVLELEAQLREHGLLKRELAFDKTQALAEAKATYERELAQAQAQSTGGGGGGAAGMAGAIMPAFAPLIAQGAEGFGRGAAAALGPTLERMLGGVLAKLPGGGAPA